MLDSVRWHIVNGSHFDLLALGVAGWMRYVGGVDEQGRAIEISDPLLPVIQNAVRSSNEGEERVQALLAIDAIFGRELPQVELFKTGLHKHILLYWLKGEGDGCEVCSKTEVTKIMFYVAIWLSTGQMALFFWHSHQLVHA